MGARPAHWYLKTCLTLKTSLICSDPPNSISVPEFMSSEEYGRYSIVKARRPYTCGLTGKTRTAEEVIRREDLLARGIGKALQFDSQSGSEWDRVCVIFSLNTIDYIPLTHSIHRLNGIASLSSAALSASELEHQLRASRAKAIFTCVPLLDTALKATEAVGISRENVFLLPVPGDSSRHGFKTIDDLIQDGEKLPPLPPLQWTKGRGARQTAYLLYSSGTSGLPKPVMLSHYNIISGIIQTCTFDSVSRKADGVDTQVMLGVLPFSHVFGLMLITHLGTYRGDEIIVMPRFEFEPFLAAVSRFKIHQLPIVPPIVIQMLDRRELCSKYDLSSVRFVYTGAAPLGKETVDDLLSLYPMWRLGQGYGMTETATVFIQSSEHDTQVGTTGSLLPAAKARIVDPDGKEITEYEKPGELLIQSPTVSLGYFNNPKATAETFFEDTDGRWIRTGDEVLVRMSESGNEHFVVVDRVKELIKVKGHQVAPAELESHLLTHPDVSDCAVIQIPDARAGEVPKAFVVKAEQANKSDEDIARDIQRYVEEHKARYKWLKGGVEFIDVIPKSPTGKILRRMLRDREREARKSRGAKL
ncbi:phenylacetyl ligase [Fusarium tjaetaba]|uniref:Phenylacetyl ligase n=1 Tax=Fusarium tjaetaba TaxID=1567544 RepID=A0A8H5QUE0_9HYPO|nr:phenylacetyl ligase [Fusarium tjaetaba]KAF5621522.1 phenylacetyl ligase [Fusarium tjaetaba]